jgi:MFS family permease
VKHLIAPHLAAARLADAPSLWPVLGFGVSMIVDYGALYYSFTLLAPRISEDRGWSLSFIFGSLSAAFFCAGVVAPTTGRLLDRFGGRIVMSWGTIAGASTLVAMAMANGRLSFSLALILAEIAGTALLYNAAFTTLTQIYGRGARRAITFTTLAAAFSSSIFWPLVSWLLTELDWRQVLLVLAGLLLAISLPIHLLLPADRRSEDSLQGGSAPRAAAHPEPPVLDGTARRRAFVLVALSFSMTGFVISALPLHLIPVLTSLGFTGTAAVLLASLIGPSQFLIRFLEMTAGQRLSALSVGLIAATLVPLGLLILIFGGASLGAGVLFALVYGMGQGLESIAKGIVPLALFGTSGYGAVLGKLAMAGLFVSAGAPWFFSLVRDSYGPMAALILIAVAGSVAAVAYLGIPRPATAQPT